eukprot:Awhi_evm1s14290
MLYSLRLDKEVQKRCLPLSGEEDYEPYEFERNEIPNQEKRKILYDYIFTSKDEAKATTLKVLDDVKLKFFGDWNEIYYQRASAHYERVEQYEIFHFEDDPTVLKEKQKPVPHSSVNEDGTSHLCGVDCSFDFEYYCANDPGMSSTVGVSLENRCGELSLEGRIVSKYMSGRLRYRWSIAVVELTMSDLRFLKTNLATLERKAGKFIARYNNLTEMLAKQIKEATVSTAASKKAPLSIEKSCPAPKNTKKVNNSSSTGTTNQQETTKPGILKPINKSKKTPITAKKSTGDGPISSSGEKSREMGNKTTTMELMKENQKTMVGEKSREMGNKTTTMELMKENQKTMANGKVADSSATEAAIKKEMDNEKEYPNASKRLKNKRPSKVGMDSGNIVP